MHQQRSITVTYGRQNLDQKGSVEGAIDRIFSQKTTVYGQIEFTSESVLEGIFKIVLKAMAESFNQFNKEYKEYLVIFKEVTGEDLIAKGTDGR